MVTEIEPPDLPKLATYQRRVLFSRSKNVAVEASTKSGKTVGCILWLFYMAWNFGRDGSEHWWIAPVFRQTKIAYRRLRRMLHRADPAGHSWKAHDTDLTITLANGAVIRFLSGDDPDNLYGDDVRDVVIDEASRCKEQVWYAVVSILTATDGNCRVIGNVKGRKTWAYRLARKAEAGEPGWAYGKFTAVDAVKAGFIKQERLDQAERDLPQNVFRELYYAEPSDDGANPFGLQHIAGCIAPKSDSPPAAFGVDLAQKVDWTVCIGLDHAGAVSRFDRWQGLAWDTTEDRIAGTIGNTPAAVDETGVGAPVTERLQRRCRGVEGFTFSSRSKQQLMAQLAVAIQQRRVSFPDGPIRAELESMEFEHTASGVRYTSPDGSHDDCVMALALAVRKLDLCENAPRVMVEWGGQEPERDTRPLAERFASARADPDWGFSD